MFKVKVQSKFKTSYLVFGLGVCAVVIYVLISKIIHHNFPAFTLDYFFHLLKLGIGFALLFLAILFPFFESTPFVSELIFYDDALTLVYKRFFKEFKRVDIPFRDIKSVKIKQEVNNRRAQNRLTLTNASSWTYIYLNDDRIVSFVEGTSRGYNHGDDLFGDCPYAYFLRLFKVQSYLPNFTFEVVGTSDSAKEDIFYFINHGKRIPFYKRKLNSSAYIIIILAVIALGLVGYLILKRNGVL